MKYTYVVWAEYGEYDDRWCTLVYAGQNVNKALQVLDETEEKGPHSKWDALSWVHLDVFQNGVNIGTYDQEDIRRLLGDRNDA